MSLRNFEYATNRFTANRGVPGFDHKGRRTFTPLPGWWRVATCEEFKCHKFLNGWVSIVPKTEIGMLTAIYQMRSSLTWTFGEEHVQNIQGEPSIRFQFPQGLTCPENLPGNQHKMGHKLPIERDPLFFNRQAGRPMGGRPLGQRMDYDEFFERSNESAHRATQARGRG